MQKYRLTTQAQLIQEGLLKKIGLKYPQMVLSTCTIPVEQGATFLTKTVVINGPLPRMCYIIQVSRASYLGSLYEDPLYFQNFNLSELYLEHEGNRYPSLQGYTPNFEINDLARENYIFKRELNFTNKNLCFPDSGWDAGYCIFPVSLTPDRSTNVCEEYMTEPPNSRILNLHIKWRCELPKAIVVVCIMEFYRVLILDQNSKARMD